MDQYVLQTYISFSLLTFLKYQYRQRNGIILLLEIPSWMTSGNDGNLWVFHLQHQPRLSNNSNGTDSSTSYLFKRHYIITTYPTLYQYLVSFTFQVLFNVQLCIIVLNALLRFHFLASLVILLAIILVIYTIYLTVYTRELNKWNFIERLLLSFFLFCFSYLSFFVEISYNDLYYDLYNDIFLSLFTSENMEIWCVAFILITTIYLKLNCIYTKFFLAKSMEDDQPMDEVLKYLHLIDKLLQLYGCVVLLAPWFCLLSFLLSQSKLLFLCSLGPYIYFKLKSIFKIFFDLHMAYDGFMSDFMFGTPPTYIELRSAGMCCPVCYGHFTVPVKLKCNHIFCRDCVSPWITKRTSCPICRIPVEKIIPEFNLRDTSIQWY